MKWSRARLVMAWSGSAAVLVGRWRKAETIWRWPQVESGEALWQADADGGKGGESSKDSSLRNVRDSGVLRRRVRHLDFLSRLLSIHNSDYGPANCARGRTRSRSLPEGVSCRRWVGLPSCLLDSRIREVGTRLCWSRSLSSEQYRELEIHQVQTRGWQTGVWRSRSKREPVVGRGLPEATGAMRG